MFRKCLLLLAVVGLAGRLQASGAPSPDQDKISAATEITKEQSEQVILGMADHYTPSQKDVDRMNGWDARMEKLYPEKAKMPIPPVYKLAITEIEADKPAFRKYFNTQESEDKAFDSQITQLKNTVNYAEAHPKEFNGASSGSPAASHKTHKKAAASPTEQPQDAENGAGTMASAPTPLPPTATPTPPKDDLVGKAANDAVGGAVKGLGF